MGLFVRCARQCGKLHKNGGVAEWTKAAALKAVEGPVPSVGSNPTPSAKQNLFDPRPDDCLGPPGCFLHYGDTELVRAGRIVCSDLWAC